MDYKLELIAVPVSDVDRAKAFYTEPGSVKGLQLVVTDIEAARTELLERGVPVGEIQSFDWGDFVFFSDPDGNAWSVQGMPARV